MIIEQIEISNDLVNFSTIPLAKELLTTTLIYSGKSETSIINSNF